MLKSLQMKKLFIGNKKKILARRIYDFAVLVFGSKLVSSEALAKETRKEIVTAVRNNVFLCMFLPPYQFPHEYQGNSSNACAHKNVHP